MEIKVFDYAGAYKLVDIPDNWERIHVLVLSGDEIVTVDSAFTYDASDCRMEHFYDGQYEITRDRFEEWNNRTCAYGYLYGEDEEELEYEE